MQVHRVLADVSFIRIFKIENYFKVAVNYIISSTCINLFFIAFIFALFSIATLWNSKTYWYYSARLFGQDAIIVFEYVLQ